MTLDRKALLRRTVEIDYRHRHRHLPGSLSALPIIADIYEQMNDDDVFILSKGHSCAALYAVLEAIGKHPNCALVHPEKDWENGVTITAGSLGHGLPIAVGIAYGRVLTNQTGVVHVLMGDGEAQEGTTWEALNMASRLNLGSNLVVHMDENGYQGSDAASVPVGDLMERLFPIRRHKTNKGQGIARFEGNPVQSVHLVTDQDYLEIMEELK